MIYFLNQNSDDKKDLRIKILTTQNFSNKVII